MTIEEAIYQLEDLRKDRKLFAELDEIFEKDIEAIDVAIKALKKIMPGNKGD